MNDVRTVAGLERALQDLEPEPLRQTTLVAIRTQGRRRRNVRATAALTGVVAATVIASVGVAAVTGGDRSGARDPGPSRQSVSSPETLSPLARRALAEIPGAVQLSSTQVSVPEPPDAERVFGAGYEIDPRLVASGPFDGGGARDYSGVTLFEGGTFPSWLHDGVVTWENEHSPPGSHLVGSIDTGILVDVAETQVACVHIPHGGLFATNGKPHLPSSGPLYDPDKPCQVSVVHEEGSHLTFGRNPAPVDIFGDGTGVHVFQATTELPQVGTLWVGGAPGTDVASVDLVLADGTTVHPTVASGTMVPGRTVFWATVPGVLSEVVTRDADGDVLGQHTLQPCPQTPEDCRL